MVSVCHHYATSDCQAVCHISQAFCSPFFFSIQSVIPPSSLSFSWQLSPLPFSILAPSALLFLFHPSIHLPLPSFFSLALLSSLPLFQSAVTFFSLSLFLCTECLPLFLCPIPLSPYYFCAPPNDLLLLVVCFCYYVWVMQSMYVTLRMYRPK